MVSTVLCRAVLRCVALAACWGSLHAYRGLRGWPVLSAPDHSFWEGTLHSEWPADQGCCGGVEVQVQEQAWVNASPRHAHVTHPPPPVQPPAGGPAIASVWLAIHTSQFTISLACL